MSIEEDSWVPDFIPDFSTTRPRIIRGTVSGEAQESFLELIEDFDLTPKRAIQSIMNFGITVGYSETISSYQITERDRTSLSRRALTLFYPAKIDPADPITDYLKLKLSPLAEDILRHFANRHQVTAEQIWSGMIIQGAGCIRAQISGQKDYLMQRAGREQLIEILIRE